MPLRLPRSVDMAIGRRRKRPAQSEGPRAFGLGARASGAEDKLNRIYRLVMWLNGWVGEDWAPDSIPVSKPSST